MKPLKLPIFHHTDNTSRLKTLDIEYNLIDCEVRNIIFYNIEAISPYLEENYNFTSIHCNSSEYICTKSIEEVETLIKNNNA